MVSTAIVVTGCASRNNEGQATDTTASTVAKPSIAVTVKPAPEQPRNSRRPVEFDPCFEIGDDTVRRAGFDPITRERSDQIHDGYAFISCAFERKEEVRGEVLRVGSLTISSTNVTLDEFRKREGSSAAEIKVNEREAITYRRPEAEACYVVMAGPDGTLDISVSSAGALTNWNACDQAQNTAEIVAATLPAE
ncbi:DUF3558 domain-containing protein [Nocardia xishanensis]